MPNPKKRPTECLPDFLLFCCFANFAHRYYKRYSADNTNAFLLFIYVCGTYVNIYFFLWQYNNRTKQTSKIYATEPFPISHTKYLRSQNFLIIPFLCLFSSGTSAARKWCAVMVVAYLDCTCFITVWWPTWAQVQFWISLQHKLICIK